MFYACVKITLFFVLCWLEDNSDSVGVLAAAFLGICWQIESNSISCKILTETSHIKCFTGEGPRLHHKLIFLFVHY